MENLAAEIAPQDIPEKKQTGLGKFAYTLLMFLVDVGIIALVVVLFFKEQTHSVLLIGIVLNLIYALICFKVKRGYRPLMVWWGILALATVAWWAYLLVQG